MICEGHCCKSCSTGSHAFTSAPAVRLHYTKPEAFVQLLSATVSYLVHTIGRYQSWSEAVGKATASVAVLYSSDYGYSDRLSQTLARGITKAGAATEMVDVLSVDPQVSYPVSLVQYIT